MAESLIPQSVFISYSQSDQDFVERLMSDLYAAGISIWMDRSGLKTGTHSQQMVIRDAMHQCYAVLLVASPDAGESDVVASELAIAKLYNRRVIPVWAAGLIFNECIPPDSTTDLHIDARSDHDTAIEDILAALAYRYERLEQKISVVVEHDFEPPNPYKGIAPFAHNDRNRFFGRERLINDMLNLLSFEDQRFLAITGPPEAGKSSFLMAGLLPELQDGAITNSDEWLYATPFTPGTTPTANLSEALKSILPDQTIEGIAEQLEGGAKGLLSLAETAITHLDGRVVLVIDQFEELFSGQVSEDERRYFIKLITSAAASPIGEIMVLITLRSDRFDRPMNYPELSRLLEANTRYLMPMSVDDYRAAIMKPAMLKDVQLTFDDTLVGDLLFEVLWEPGGLSMLSFTLDQLFQRREGHCLTRAAYEAIGGISGAKDKLDFYTGLRDNVARWLRDDRAETTLYRGAKLIEAEGWLKTNSATETEEEFVIASLAAAKQRENQRHDTSNLRYQFLSITSHEVRTHLNTIIGFSHLMLKGIDGPLSKLQEQDLSTIHSSSRILLGLFSTLLEVEMFEEGRMEMQPDYTPIEEIVDSVMVTGRNLVRVKSIVVRSEVEPDLPEVYCDANRLQQVLLHLLRNAATYTEEGQITLRVFKQSADPETHEPDRVQFEISDTGIGMAEGQRNRLFESLLEAANFNEAAAQRKGMSLRICKYFVELHHGHIWVESEPDEGTTIGFTLPFNPPG